MNDPLYNKIVDGLNRLTDREKFESCAVDLLKKDYPRLVSVSGGGDAGYDGAARQADGERIQLVCTSGADAEGNLRANLTEARKKNRESEAVLFVTSRKLSPQQKEKLRMCAGEFGKTLYPVYDREPIANLIYRNSRWRKDLLGITGNPPALSLVPVNHRPTFGISLIGRDTEISQISEATADLVVVGQPGAGKTSLLGHVAVTTEGYFVVSDDRTAIAEGIRDQKPKWLIVDDAFSRIEEIVVLQQIREDIGADFRIVAACWPGEQATVSAKLSLDPSAALQLLPLPVSEIKRIVTAMGIGGPDYLVGEILHQSVGKPGLAVTLCQICFQRGTRALLTAEALLQDVKQSLDALAGEDAVGLLSHFALAGDGGLTIERAAEATGLAPLAVHRMAESMGAAGILEVHEGGQLSVEPARLRQALVGDMFGRRPRGLDWQRVIGFMPERADCLETLIASAMLGGKYDDRALQREIVSLRETRQFNELCEYYARIGAAQSRWVLVQFPGLVERVAGSLLEHIPADAIPPLLRTDAARETGPRQERDELLPIRNWIDERAKVPAGFARRIELLSALETMRAELKNTRTLVAGVRLVIGITFELVTPQPGEPAAIVLHHGHVSMNTLRQIAELWPRILPLLEGLDTTLARSLPQVIAGWVYPRPFGQASLTPEYYKECKAHARIMVASLTAAYGGQWTVLYCFEDFAERVGHPMPKREGLTGVLFPQRRRGIDVDLDEGHRKAVIALGNDWARRGPEPAFIAEWLRTVREARDADITYPNYDGELAWRIAEQSSEPRAWLDALIAADAPVQLVDSFADRCSRQSADFAKRFAADYMPREVYRRLALACLVRHVPVTEPTWTVAAPFLQEAAGTIGTLVRRNLVPEATILYLLKCGIGPVAGLVAVNVWSADTRGTVPENVLDSWRTAVVEYMEDEHQLDDIAKAFPDVGCAWLKKRVNNTWRERLAGAGAFEHYNCLKPLIAALGSAERREVIDHIEAGNYHAEVLALLVGKDDELFLHAVSRPQTAKLVLSSLGQPPESDNAAWIRRALALLDAGITEEAVFHASDPLRGGVGPESGLHEESLKHYRPLLAHSDSRMQRIANTAVAHLTQMRDEARQRERIAAVKGVLL